MTYLPDEILSMVCTQLWHQQDLNTLFNCACSGRRLAMLAMMNLYRTQSLSPDICTNYNSDEDSNGSNYHSIYQDTPDRQQRKSHARATLMKRAAMWRTIILSSLGRTLFPYSRFLRALDLRDLEGLIIQLQLEFRATARDFFEGELAQFKASTSLRFPGETITTRLQLETIRTVESISRIGEAITNQAPLLEVLTGPMANLTSCTVFRRALSQWIPRLPRLTHLEHWNGAALSTENGTLIRLHCPSFKGLHHSPWSGHDSEPRDQNIAAFLNEIRPHSLQSFETSTLYNLERETFQALSSHGKSLTELNLSYCPSSTTIADFSLLNRCTNLVSLSLGEIQTYYSDLDILCHDNFCEIFGWLKECKNLRNLTSIRFFKPAWIGPIFLENSIYLTSLEYVGFQMRDTKKFHQALAHQTSLQTLWLTGDEDEFDEDEFDEDEFVVDADILVESLSKLINLTDLRLEGISRFFVDRHFVQLASNLPKLEIWSIDGRKLTDAIWEEVASLRSLNKLFIWASTSCFTTQGIVVFIEKLGAGNEGLVLSVTDVTGNSCVDQDLIREEITKKVNGWFKFSSGPLSEDEFMEGSFNEFAILESESEL